LLPPPPPRKKSGANLIALKGLMQRREVGCCIHSITFKGKMWIEPCPIATTLATTCRCIYLELFSTWYVKKNALFRNWLMVQIKETKNYIFYFGSDRFLMKLKNINSEVFIAVLMINWNLSVLAKLIEKNVFLKMPRLVLNITILLMIKIKLK
jgi:hypothetical protein